MRNDDTEPGTTEPGDMTDEADDDSRVLKFVPGGKEDTMGPFERMFASMHVPHGGDLAKACGELYDRWLESQVNQAGPHVEVLGSDLAKWLRANAKKPGGPADFFAEQLLPAKRYRLTLTGLVSMYLQTTPLPSDGRLPYLGA